MVQLFTTNGVAINVKFNNFVDSSYIVARNTDAELSVKASIAKLGVGDSGLKMLSLNAGVC
ncbi:MAG: hypothetical protein U0518_01510 [Candidatus Gracilibacteria bacterium]